MKVKKRQGNAEHFEQFQSASTKAASLAANAVAGTYRLPTQVSSPSDDLNAYLIFIYGEKKIGKTSMWSHAKKTFYMMCEPGGKALAIYKRDIATWEAFKAYNRLVCKDKTFSTVVIDTVDWAYLYCTRFMMAKLGIEHPSDLEWGKGWGMVREEFTSEISRLAASGKGVVFISHAEEKEIKTRNGGKYDRIVPTVGKAARDILEGLVDVWAYYHYDGEKRYLQILGDDHVAAGNRIGQHFLTPSGKRIRRIPMGGSSNEAYGNFIKAFNNQLGV